MGLMSSMVWTTLRVLFVRFRSLVTLIGTLLFVLARLAFCFLADLSLSLSWWFPVCSRQPLESLFFFANAEEAVKPHVPEVHLSTQLSREARDRPERAARAAAKSTAGERAYDITRADALLYPRAIVPNFAQSISHEDPVIGRDAGIRFLDRQYQLDRPEPVRGLEWSKVLSREARDKLAGGATSVDLVRLDFVFFGGGGGKIVCFERACGVGPRERLVP